MTRKLTKFQQLNEANEVLSDPEKEKYDQYGKTGSMLNNLSRQGNHNNNVMATKNFQVILAKVNSLIFFHPCLVIWEAVVSSNDKPNSVVKIIMLNCT